MSTERGSLQSDFSKIEDSDVDSSPNPSDWKQALACLIASRLAILQAESKDATKSGGKKIALLFVATFCLLFTWILLLAGGIGAIAQSTSWAWFHVAFAAAGLHILIAIIAVLLAKSKSTSPFPITRAEFEKDRKWLHQFKNPSK